MHWLYCCARQDLATQMVRVVARALLCPGRFCPLLFYFVAHKEKEK